MGGGRWRGVAQDGGGLIWLQALQQRRHGGVSRCLALPWAGARQRFETCERSRTLQGQHQKNSPRSKGVTRDEAPEARETLSRTLLRYSSGREAAATDLSGAGLTTLPSLCDSQRQPRHSCQNLVAGLDWQRVPRPSLPCHYFPIAGYKTDQFRPLSGTSYARKPQRNRKTILARGRRAACQFQTEVVRVLHPRTRSHFSPLRRPQVQ